MQLFMPDSLFFDDSITPKAKFFYSMVIEQCKKEFDCCYISTETWENDFGYNKRTLEDWIKQLKQGGYIDRVTRCIKGVYRKVTIVLGEEAQAYIKNKKYNKPAKKEQESSRIVTETSYTVTEATPGAQTGVVTAGDTITLEQAMTAVRAISEAEPMPSLAESSEPQEIMIGPCTQMEVAAEIIETLNEESGKKHKVTPGLLARLHTHQDFEDCMTVIANAARAAKKKGFLSALNPRNLFEKNFDRYLNWEFYDDDKMKPDYAPPVDPEWYFDWMGEILDGDDQLHHELAM